MNSDNMKIYRTDYNALIEVINENIRFCQNNIETIMNENILGRFLHRKDLSYWEGKIDAYQDLLLRIEVTMRRKGCECDLKLR